MRHSEHISIRHYFYWCYCDNAEQFIIANKVERPRRRMRSVGLETPSWSSDSSANQTPERTPSNAAHLPSKSENPVACHAQLSVVIWYWCFLLLFNHSVYLLCTRHANKKFMCVCFLILRVVLWHQHPCSRKERLSWVTGPRPRTHKGHPGFKPILSDLPWVLLSPHHSSLSPPDWWPFPPPRSENQKTAFCEWS